MNRSTIAASVAGRYALALCDTDDEQLSRIKSDFGIFNLVRSRLIDSIFAYHSVHKEDSLKIIAILNEFLSERFINFLTVLIANYRYNLIDRIEKIFNILYNDRQGSTDVCITSAVQIEEDIKNKIKQRMEEKIQKKVNLSCEIDESLIGGFVITTENTMIDLSIKNRTQQLSEYLRNSYHEN